MFRFDLVPAELKKKETKPKRPSVKSLFGIWNKSFMLIKRCFWFSHASPYIRNPNRNFTISQRANRNLRRTPQRRRLVRSNKPLTGASRIRHLVNWNPT